MPSGRLIQSWLRRIGSCQQTSGFMVSGSTPSLSALQCSAHPMPPAKPGRLRKMQAPLYFRVRRLRLAVVLVQLEVALAAQALRRGTASRRRCSFVTASSSRARRRRRTRTRRGCSSRRRAGPRRCPGSRRAEDAGPARHSHVRSARDQMLGVVGVVELHPLPGEVQFDLRAGIVCARSRTVTKRR